MNPLFVCFVFGYYHKPTLIAHCKIIIIILSEHTCDVSKFLIYPRFGNRAAKPAISYTV